MKKYLTLLAVLVALAAAGAGAYLYTHRATPDRDVTIAQFGDLLLYLPLYVALDHGEFQKQGLTVRVISTGGDDKTYAAVLSGDAQFGIADPTFVAIAAERGAQGKVVGLLINGMPNYAVASDPSAPVIADLSELKGRRLASVPAPSTAYAALAELYRRGGVEPDILQTSPAGLLAAGKQPGVYASVLIEPWVSQLEAEGGKVVLSMPGFFREFALTGLTTSSAMLKDDPATVEKVRTALKEGVRLVYDEPEIVLEIAKKRFPDESPEALKRGIERMRADRIYPTDLRVTRPAWDAAISLRTSSGDYKGSLEESWASVAAEAR